MKRTSLAVGCMVALAGCPTPVVEPDAAASPDAVVSPDAFAEPDAFAAPDAFVEIDAFMEPDAFVNPDAFVPECTTADDCDDGDTCNGAETCNAMGMCADGAPLAEGATCDVDGSAATRDLCLGGTCAATRCGDAFTDTMNMEQCDDGNGVSGDGCDDCRFSCEAASDCDDGESCNGAETCSAAHVCTAGTRLANGTACSGGTGRCAAGTCLPNMCTTPADCDDGDACNGVETCGATGCATAAPPTCDDGDPCTAGACVSPTGCTQTLIDADRDGHAATSLGACGDDCDDTRFEVGPGQPEICGNTVDDDCDGMTDEVGITTWYADCDADGYAATGARMLMACAMPAPGMSMCASGGGWTARAPAGASTSDCNDGNAAVNPAQSMYQTTAISGAAPAVDFDYDCNMTEEARSTGRGMCTRAGLSCNPTQGWVAATAPACGASAAWITGCTTTVTGCTQVTETRQQACR